MALDSTRYRIIHRETNRVLVVGDREYFDRSGIYGPSPGSYRLKYRAEDLIVNERYPDDDVNDVPIYEGDLIACGPNGPHTPTFRRGELFRRDWEWSMREKTREWSFPMMAYNAVVMGNIYGAS